MATGDENRGEWEIALAAALAAAGLRSMRQIDGELGESPAADAVSSLAWGDYAASLASEISDELQAAFFGAAYLLLREHPGALDDEVRLTMQAGAWASYHAGQLASDLTANTRSALERLLLRSTAEGWERRRLKDHILALFGASRAETIAITEITRAIQAGMQAAAAILATVAIVLEPYHQTAQDERVCPICGERHGRKITDGRFAPLHPRCRCSTLWILTETRQGVRI